MHNPTCSVTDCDKSVKRARSGLCYGHYMKRWRYGTPTPTHPERATLRIGQRFGTLVIVGRDKARQRWECRCDCGRTRWADTHGLTSVDAPTCGHSPTHHRSEVCGYTAAHDRVRRDRGSASAHSCIDCGGAAAQWSYLHCDPDEMVEQMGDSLVAYSTNPDYYEPRCVPCHKRFDLGRIDAARREAA